MCHRLDPLLTVQEVAEFLAVPTQTLYDWRWKGYGPRSFKVGRHLRYKESDVLAWLDEQSAAA